MRINLTYVEIISEKLLRILLKSHKIRPTIYTENTLHKLLFKPKDRVVTGDKSNFVYEVDCSNYEAVYLGESKRSLKSRSDKHKRSVRNCKIRLIPRKSKETIHSFKIPNQINKIF